MYGMSYIEKFRYFYLSYFKNISKKKFIKCRYFALIVLGIGLSFNFALKDVQSMSYILKVFGWKYAHLMDSGS